ncbi:hypothetical protein B0H13DRAFT_1986169 [Mycena leptocephala]|nr:hypothetical protein B0H13DRAFT_1986169 [Mycena leptocephala]
MSDLPTSEDRDHELQGCARQIKHILRHFSAYPTARTRTSKRLETRTPNNREAGERSSPHLPTKYDLRTTEQSSAATEDLTPVPFYPVPPNIPTAILDVAPSMHPPPLYGTDTMLSTVQWSNVSTHDRETYLYVTPFRTLPIQLARISAFIHNSISPPLRVQIEVQMAPWGVLFFTVKNRLKNNICMGSALKAKGMLTGDWIAEEKMCTRDEFAVIRVRNEMRRQIALVAVPRVHIKMEEPIGDVEKFCRALAADKDMRSFLEADEGAVLLPMNLFPCDGQQMPADLADIVDWNAVESPLTYDWKDVQV